MRIHKKAWVTNVHAKGVIIFYFTFTFPAKVAKVCISFSNKIIHFKDQMSGHTLTLHDLEPHYLLRMYLYF